MVYVLNINNKPLMPCKEAKARRLLKNKQAKIVNYEPFTIKLLFECENNTQPISLGIDPGSKKIGISTTTETKELFAAIIETRNDISELLATRRENRRTRRNRLRYRKSRFKNRAIPKEWLAPSIRHKIETHLKVIDNVFKLLPITEIRIEIANFDIQKIKNPDISGKEYQEGEQSNFWNTREYVLFRDKYTCQCCKGKSKDKILNVHHIESRKTGGNAPNNLITLCKTCHDGYHTGKINLPKTIKRGMSFKDATFMNIMKKYLYNELIKKYKDIVFITYGYKTKKTRIENNLPKTDSKTGESLHYIDARCISMHPKAKPLGYYFYIKQTRCHNRQIHKMNFSKGGIKKINQAPYLVHGFRLFDKVEFIDNGKKIKGFIFGRRLGGYFNIRTLDKSFKKDIHYKKLKLISIRKSFLIETRKQ